MAISSVCINGKAFTIVVKTPIFAVGINTPPSIMETEMIMEQRGPACFSVFAIVPNKMPRLIKNIADGIRARIASMILNETVNPNKRDVAKKIIVWHSVIGKIAKTKLKR